MLDLTAGITFGARTSYYRDDGIQPARASAGSVLPTGIQVIYYNESDQSFTIDIRGYTYKPSFQQTFRAADINTSESTDFVTVYERGGDRLTLTRAGDPDLNLKYVASAGWEAEDDVPVETGTYRNKRGYSVFGFETEFAQMPNAGEATYALRVTGTLVHADETTELGGSGALVANFASGVIETTMTIDKIENGVATVWDTISGPAMLFAGPYSGASNNFVGLMTRQSYPSENIDYSGAFFGPNAEEVGGTFGYNDQNYNDESVFGSFVGATSASNTPRPGLNTSLANLTTSEIFIAFSSVVSSPYIPFSTIRDAYLNVSYDAGTDSFVLPIPKDGFPINALANIGLVSVGPSDVDAARSDATQTVYNIANVGGLIDDSFTLFTPGASPYALSYVAIGAWRNEDIIATLPITGSGSSMLTEHIIFGQRTAQSELPVSGSATYNIHAVGIHYDLSAIRDLVGDGSIVAQFPQHGLDVQLNLSFIDGGGALTPWHSFSAPDGFSLGTYWPGDGSPTFQGVLQADDDPDLTGYLAASFFGPGADEIGGVFNVRNLTNTIGTPDPESASGAFVGTKVP